MAVWRATDIGEPRERIARAEAGRKTLQMILDTIFPGDCLELLRSLPAGRVDLVVSSPPYNLGKEYEKKRALQVYLEEQTLILKECARVLKRSGSIFWQVGAFADSGMLIPLDVRIFPILEAAGLIPRNRIVWARTHGLHASRKFSCRHETLLWFTKSDNYIFNLDAVRVPQKYQNKKAWRGERKGELTCHKDGKNPGDIWMFRNVRHNHEEETIHPCQFPEDMIARIVLATTKPGDTVLDPYMGSGTTAVVARDHGRRFLGAELDPQYHQVATRRLAGEPDKDGCFPNLRTLRNHVERTGEKPELFRFDTQVGAIPTERGKARIHPEEHHLNETIARLSYEEEAFGARIRSEEQPEDPSESKRNLPMFE